MGSLDTNPTAFSAFGDEGEAFQPLNVDDVRSYLHKAVDFISDYYKSVESMPVLPNVKPGYLQDELRASPPTYSAPFDVTMKELRTSVVPGMTHWASPNFFAFFPSTNSAAAIAGDLIASAMNTVGFTWQAAPAATEMEVLALDWLAQMLNLPTSFMNRTGEGRGTGGGVILGTTSEAMLEHIRSDVAMAKMFEEFVRGDDRFEVVVPRNFALVCFRIKANSAMTEEEADEANRELMERLNKTGKAYLAHTVVGDRFVLRFAVGSSLQEERHVRSAWELIKKTTTEMMTMN
uniref:Aromatic-L-amino-acid decarboxylase n=1 Tax=Oryza brachyantha TaxID=4533 RepID=J3MQ91_ORYBR